MIDAGKAVCTCLKRRGGFEIRKGMRAVCAYQEKPLATTIRFQTEFCRKGGSGLKLVSGLKPLPNGLGHFFSEYIEFIHLATFCLQTHPFC